MTQGSPRTTRRTRLIRLAALAALLPVVACAEPTKTAEVPPPLDGPTVPVSQEASADDLRVAALDALRHGELDRSRRLIEEAAETGDATYAQMGDWIADFQAQRAEFDKERQDDFAERVDKVKLLDEAGYVDYAARFAEAASALADDKEAFAAQPWVQDLTARAAALAEEFEAGQQWAKAANIYSSLNSIEPYNARWNEAFKSAARRLRLLAMYAPDQLDKVREAEQARAEKVNELLEPTTRPADEVAAADGTPTDNDDPAEIEDGQQDESFRIDWRDTLAGVTPQMLDDSLRHVYERYRQDVSYRELIDGGLDAAEALLTTEGLADSFPGLTDEAQKADLLDVVGQLRQETDRRNAVDQGFARRLLAVLSDANDRTVKLPEEVLVAEFSDGVLGTLDPYSAMIWPSEIAEFQKATQGNFSGVGISIRNEPGGDLTVVSPLEDSPAYEAGILAGDVITHIDGKNARGITTQQAVKTITGPAGSDVTLTVRRLVDGQPESLDFTLERSNIVVKSVKGWRHLPGGGWDYLIDEASKIAYLRVTNFTQTTADELHQAVAEVGRQGGRGIVLDLRNNPGGLLSAAKDVSDVFLDDGRIVSTRSDRNRRDEEVLDARRDRDDVELPMAVLVNEGSASASEIVSGALKDLDRATVIGQRTFGKGSVQMLFPVDRGQARLKLTTRHYYLPLGKSIHRDETDREWGVDPDLVIPLTPDQMLAAMKAGQALEVLQKADAAAGQPAAGQVEKLQEELLDADPQLSAAVLVLRLQLATPPAAGPEGVARR